LPAVVFLNGPDAAAVARSSNEYARSWPTTRAPASAMFALLPMPHVDETLKEIAYALDVLKADGVAFMTSYGNQYLGDKAFAPVMDELNRRKAPLTRTRTIRAVASTSLRAYPPSSSSTETDTTRTIASLVFSAPPNDARTSTSSSRTPAAR
jgi:hypothetical protein